MTNTTAPEDDTRPLLEKARAAMSGLAETESALTLVRTQLREARDAVQPEDTVVDVALDALLDDGALPDDLADRVLQIRRSNEATLAVAQVLGPVEQRLTERLTVLHRTQADAALYVLADELDAVLNSARPLLVQLDGVHDAETAINADRVAVWRQATQLAERHVALRGAQRVIVAGSLDPPDQARLSVRVSPEIRTLIDNYGFVRDPARHYPELGGSDPNRTEARTGTVRIFSGRVLSDVHTDAPVRPRPWQTGDSLDDLRFLTRPDVTAWVPRVASLTAARAEHERHQQAEARAAAERRPGDDDQPFVRRGRQMPPPPAALTQRIAEETLGIRDPL